jgi:hypothetical protein
MWNIVFNILRLFLKVKEKPASAKAGSSFSVDETEKLVEKDVPIPPKSLEPKVEEPEQLRLLLATSQKGLSGCHPELQRRALELVRLGWKNNLSFGVYMALRTWDVQKALYLQGRVSLGEVNKQRSIAGLKPIVEAENRIVTQADAGSSWHNYGLAVDLVEDGDPTMAGIQWSWKNNFNYLKLGALGKEVGLSWGGLWKSFKDYPHFEMTGGLSLGEAKRLYLIRKSLKDVWSSVKL